MILPDVNVLVYAFRDDSHQHALYRAWLREAVDSDAPFGLSDIVLASLTRVVTNPRIYSRPTTTASVLAFAEALRSRRNCVSIVPGDRHWEIFSGLCLRARIRGNLVTDAYLAALAIESGCEFITTDRDFARFSGLRWRHPLK